eukprot:COSAG01_NODE_10374_length_2182_cov_2.667787_1_plen_95_part_00
MLHFKVLRHFRVFLVYMDQKTALNKLWAIIEDEFWKIPPAKLYCIFEHKVDIARQVIREGGRKLKIECHGGARKRTELAIAASAAAASESESSE